MDAYRGSILELPSLTRKCQQIFMTTFFTTDPGKSHMKIIAVQVFENHSHDVCPPETISGSIHVVIPCTFQIFKMIFKALVIRACFRIARLINIITICCRLSHSEIETCDKIFVYVWLEIKPGNRG